MDTSETIATIAAGIAGMSLALSAISAFTAHKARTWQRDRDRERLRTRITVTVHGVCMFVAGVPHAGVTLIVTNEGETTEYVEAAKVQAAAPDSTRILRVHHLPAPVEGMSPRELPPRSNIRFNEEFGSDIEWLRSGLVGTVYLASGRLAFSDVSHVHNLPERPAAPQ